MHLNLITSVAVFLASIFIAGTQASGPECYEVVVPVTISKVDNIAVPSGGLAMFTIRNLLSGLVMSIFTGITPAQGSFQISGRYCEPEVTIENRQNTLQLLAHPATYDRNYWSGGGYPGFGYEGERYSWVAYASHLGYPTFAFDRLGNGNSSHPDAVTVVQCLAQAEVYHELIKRARSGTGGFPRQFRKVVLVGNSLGSIIANTLNIKYPDDVDATILGGFSREWLPAVPGFIAQTTLLPAPNLPLGYLQATSRGGVAYVLFYGPGRFYDEKFINQDYDNRGTVTVGEGASGALGIGIAPGYKKPVLVISGEQDVLFCGTLATGAIGNCRSGILEQTRELYPAGDYSWFVVPNAGHCWHHQYSATEGFKYSHDWLTRKGF